MAVVQAQMAPLRLDDVGELGAERGGGLPGVRRADPEPVGGADVAEIRPSPYVLERDADRDADWEAAD